MSVVSISIIVSQQSQILENKLLQVDTDFDSAEAAALYRDALDIWLDEVPLPGQEKRTVVIDRASLLAAQLPEIILARDPNIFGLYDIDSEGELAIIERRPYNWENLELTG